LSSSQTSKQEGEEEGSHYQANPVAPDLQNRWHRFWAVCLFRCEGASPEIPEISPEIPDFPETPEKSLENPGVTDKFVLSRDFSGLAYSPPPPAPSRQHQDPFKYKSEVFEKFQEFQSLVERLFNRKIVAVQSDWGGEYEKLHSFFTKIGISHLVSCPHAHQRNGAAKRKHRHIVEVGLSLLAHAHMPLKFWDEAFLAATFLINRTPSKVINFDMPLERLFHTQPDYSSLRVFGCACWPNLHPHNKQKLAFRSKECVFLGYSNLHKGFKCLDISSGRIYISRDVIFDEDIFPFSRLHSNAGARLCSEILLLPPSLQNPSSGDEFVDDHVSNGENSNNFGAETDLLSHAGEEYNTGTGSGAHPPLFPRRSPAGFALTGVSAGRSASAPASSPALHPRSATPPAASAPPSVLPDTSLSAHGDSTSQPAPALSLSLSAPTASTLGSSAVPATDPPGSSTPLPGPGGSSAPGGAGATVLPGSSPIALPSATPAAAAPVLQTRPRTRLQDGIRKPKTYNDDCQVWFS
jgi:hypothetical protein